MLTSDELTFVTAALLFRLSFLLTVLAVILDRLHDQTGAWRTLLTAVLTTALVYVLRSTH